MIWVATATGCKTVRPSNDRDWAPEMSVLSYALKVEDDVAEIHNVRNCHYESQDDFVVDWYDKRLRLSDARTVDFIVVPFQDMPLVAHTMLSFGFADDYHLCVSVEIRRELGETYSPVKGGLRQYELMYVLGDERDLIELRAIHRHDNVYLYRTKATPDQAAALLADVLDRVNKLHNEPEFYDTLTNNCTTNIWQHVNRLKPGRVPLDYRVLLPGLADRLAYDDGLIETSGTFEETRRAALVNDRVLAHRDSPEFSALIRR